MARGVAQLFQIALNVTVDARVRQVVLADKMQVFFRQGNLAARAVITSFNRMFRFSYCGKRRLP